jgi:hypothetical protein
MKRKNIIRTEKYVKIIVIKQLKANNKITEAHKFVKNII